MRRWMVALTLAASVTALAPAANAQRLTTETLRGEWVGKIEGAAAANDAGDRAIRFWTTLGTDGSGRIAYAVNGKEEDALPSISVEQDTLTFATKDRARVSVKQTVAGELTGTITPPGGAAARIRFVRQAPPKTFDRTYSGRAESPGTNLCIALELKVVIKDGHLTGTLGSSYASISFSFDLTGEVWSNGDVSMTATRGGVFAGYSRGRIENGRYKQKFSPFRDCGEYSFDLR